MARPTASIGPTSGPPPASHLVPKPAEIDQTYKNTTTPRPSSRVLGDRTKRSQATVRSVNPNQDGKVWEEVELRLRSRISPHNCTGYEVMFRCSKIPQAYCNVA